MDLCIFEREDLCQEKRQGGRLTYNWSELKILWTLRSASVGLNICTVKLSFRFFLTIRSIPHSFSPKNVCVSVKAFSSDDLHFNPTPPVFLSSLMRSIYLARNVNTVVINHNLSFGPSPLQCSRRLRAAHQRLHLSHPRPARSDPGSRVPLLPHQYAELIS